MEYSITFDDIMSIYKYLRWGETFDKEWLSVAQATKIASLLIETSLVFSGEDLNEIETTLRNTIGQELDELKATKSIDLLEEKINSIDTKEILISKITQNEAYIQDLEKEYNSLKGDLDPVIRKEVEKSLATRDSNLEYQVDFYKKKIAQQTEAINNFIDKISQLEKELLILKKKGE